MSTEPAPARQGRARRFTAGLQQAVGPRWSESLLWGTLIFGLGSVPAMLPVFLASGWALSAMQGAAGKNISVPFDTLGIVTPLAIIVAVIVVVLCTGACLIVGRLRGLKLFPMFLVGCPMLGLTSFVMFLIPNLQI